jgi:phasin family protein
MEQDVATNETISNPVTPAAPVVTPAPAAKPVAATVTVTTVPSEPVAPPSATAADVVAKAIAGRDSAAMPTPPTKPAVQAAPAKGAVKPVAKVAAKPAAKVAAKPAAKTVAKVAAKPVTKPTAKTVAKTKTAAAKPVAAKPNPLITTIKKDINIMASKIETTAETLKTTLTNGAETVAAQTKAAYEQASVKAKEALSKGVKSVEDYNAMNRDNLEALMSSSRIAVKGMETIGRHIADASKTNFEATTAAIKSMTAVKTPTELMQVQSDFAKAQFDTAVTNFSKLTEALVKLSGEVMEPISNRVAITVDKVSKSVAAK